MKYVTIIDSLQYTSVPQLFPRDSTRKCTLVSHGKPNHVLL